MPEEPRIRLVDLAGDDYCVDLDDAERARDALAVLLRDHAELELSFEGVNLVTTAFLNVAIGELYGEFPIDDLQVRLQPVDIAPDDRALWELVVHRAVDFYRDPEGFRARWYHAHG